MRTTERFRAPKGVTIIADSFRCPLCGGKYLARKRRAVKHEGQWKGVCPQCLRDIRKAERK